MSSDQDLYGVLGVDKNHATEDVIKKAYKKLAMKHHPDRGGDPEHFKKISEAYSILSDPEKKAKYDQFGLDGLHMPEMNMNVNDLFGNLFGGGGMPNVFGRPPSSMTSVPPLQYTIEITLEQVMTGTTLPFEYTRKRYHQGKRCGICQGKGSVLHTQNVAFGIFSQSISPCRTCSGSGMVFQDHEAETLHESIQIPIPVGIHDGRRLVIRGKGDEYPKQAPGDVILTVHYLPHPFYRVRSPLDLECDIHISLQELLDGFERYICLLDGSWIRIHQPEGPMVKRIENGITRTFPGKGFRKHSESGNLVLCFIVDLISSPLPQDKFITLSNPSKDKKIESIDLRRYTSTR